MRKKLFRKATDERGSTMIEYALMAALIAMVAISSVSIVGIQTVASIFRIAGAVAGVH